MEKNRGCGFRPKSFAAQEMGCPLDHCSYCGMHDHEDAPCAEMVISKRHHEWRDEVRERAFRTWLKVAVDVKYSTNAMELSVTSMLRLAFFAGLDGNHNMDEMTMGDCGQKDCYDCHSEEFSECDDVTR